ncbi:hypothetical protein [Streptomyces fagopyri]|uniref:hypothetical protein n=1 Tax=Streptomyces fagopyri TaxID=2662397 RepID=UPI0037F39B62
MTPFREDRTTAATLAGEIRCGYSPTSGAPACETRATWHLAWTRTPEEVIHSLICDLHMGWVQDDLTYADRHPLSADCGMPGTGWHDGTPSHCGPPPSDDAPDPVRSLR